MAPERSVPGAAASRSARESGVALLSVLFILVLLSTLSVYTLEDQYLALRRIANQQDAEQGYQLAAGAEQWVMKVLQRDGAESETDHLNEAWNNVLPAVAVERGKLSALVTDEQARFNLNNLQAGRDEVWYPAFVRLLRVLGLEEGIADAVVDWIDADPDVGGASGAEDPEYLLKDPAYRAANRAFVDVGELLWVAGVDRKVLATLAPYVSALPSSNVPINVNTCALPLLQILSAEGLGEDGAQALVDARGEEGYPGVGEFLAQPALAGSGDVAEPLVAVSTSYFKVVSDARFGRLRFVLESHLQRAAGANAVVVRQRRRGLS